MKKYKIYETVKNYLTLYYEAVHKEQWLKWLVSGTGLPEKDVLKVVEEMFDEGLLYEYGGKVYYLDNVHYMVGHFNVVREQFAFVENAERSVYINERHFNHALDRDEVLISIHQETRDFGKIITSVKHHREVLLGTIKRLAGEVYFLPYEKKVYQSVKIVDTEVNFKENDRVIGEIVRFGESLDVKIIEVLGQADAPGMDVLSVLHEYEFDIEFPDEVQAILGNIPQEVMEKDKENRRDHRDQYVITIDGEDAKDLDDAIYLERLHQGYRLYVHIADVAHYVPSGSLLDTVAAERASSIYMVDRVVPMLPKEISNGICSLHPNVDRLAMTCQMDFDLEGNVIDYHIYESVIRSKQRLSYTEVNLRENLGEAEEMVEQMFHLADILNRKRRHSGAIDFDSDESEFVIDNEGNVLDIFKRERGEGEEMIEAFMVATNEVLASHCKYQSIPVLYRIHEKPEKERLQELSHTLRILGYRMRGSLEKIHPKTLQKALKFFENKDELPVVSRLMLRTMAKARYKKDPVGHFGLALDDYTHFTAPIRRYPDLLLHQRIKKYVFDANYESFEEDEKALVSLGDYVSEKERSIMEAERLVEKMKKAQYMADKVGDRYVGYISGVTNFGVFVELSNTVEGLVHIRNMKDDYYVFDGTSQTLIGERSGKTFRLGQRVEVEVTGVDTLEHEVHFKLLKTKKKKRKRNNGKKSKKRRS